MAEITVWNLISDSTGRNIIGVSYNIRIRLQGDGIVPSGTIGLSDITRLIESFELCGSIIFVPDSVSVTIGRLDIFVYPTFFSPDTLKAFGPSF